jgi:hypothetical protein
LRAITKATMAIASEKNPKPNIKPPCESAWC